MSELLYASAIELAAKIKSGDVSSVEVTQAYIDRIEALDGEINAVIVRRFDEALAEARAADEALAAGQDVGPLHGVPMTIKESYNMAGTATTWGVEAFANNTFEDDGLTVRRFKAAGAHFLGKTNVPKDLGDVQSYNVIYGTTNNPWNLEHAPGGSSGGSAASLAAGFAGLEAGSDIGGSIRTPAHFCGVYGHKPTYGIIPWQGHELVAKSAPPDLAVTGPLARSAQDLALALDIMAGPNDRDAVGWGLNLPAADFTDLKSLRVAIWSNYEGAPATQETQQRVLKVGEILEGLGAKVSYDARPDFDVARADANYRSLVSSVMSAGLNEEAFQAGVEAAAALDPQDMGPNAISLRASVMSHRTWVRANAYRERLRYAWDDFFNEWDILVCPQSSTPAIAHDQRPFGERTITVDGETRPYFEQIYWSGLIVNSYLPSTCFPSGASSEGLPIGLQAVSGPYRDHRSIEFARQITEHIGGFEIPARMADTI